MADWLDRVHEAQETIRNEHYELKGLAAAFERTGNIAIAEELYLRAQAIYDAQKQIGDAIGEMLTEQIQSDSRQIGETFKALLESRETP